MAAEWKLWMMTTTVLPRLPLVSSSSASHPPTPPSLLLPSTYPPDDYLLSASYNNSNNHTTWSYYGGGVNSSSSSWLATATTLLMSTTTTSGVVDSMESSSSEEEDERFPAYVSLLMMLSCGLILVVGLVGNCLVPVVIWNNRDLRNSTNLFLLNLSLADILVLCVSMPTVLVEIYERRDTWIFGKVMCEFSNPISISLFYSGGVFCYSFELVAPATRCQKIIIMAGDQVVAVVEVGFS